MKNKDFYNELDNELSHIVEETLSSPEYANLKEEHQKKSYALLIWFLKNYAHVDNVEDYITEGHDDHSCDIILDRVTATDERVFYLVQSKWNQLSKCDGKLDSEIVKSLLSDAQSIIKGDKEEGINDKFNHRYKALREHVLKNGAVRVIYLTLKNKSDSTESNKKTFESTLGGDIEVDSFDINRLKSDYIDRKFKGSFAPDPLSKVYNPEWQNISIKKVTDSRSSHLTMEAPYEAHVVTVKPSLIFDWVSQYGVALFDKNVRNPLIESSINTGIKDTLLNNPASFWYFNNGITAITKSIPKISSAAEEFEVTGLQIINGAQTAYSIYSAYKSASFEQRKVIDEGARVTLRLLKSGGRDFDLQVTRYTNSQNPVTERDFWSNDPLQNDIQRFFYDTSTWYEKRSGEFRSVPEGISIIENTHVAAAYLAFWLEDPVSIFNSFSKKEQGGVDLIFTSYIDNKDGLYEKIFNSETNPEDMLAAYMLLDLILKGKRRRFNSFYRSSIPHSLAWMKVLLTKYLSQKYPGKPVNISKFIVSNISSKEELFLKLEKFVSGIFNDKVKPDTEEPNFDVLFNILSKRGHFEVATEELKSLKFDCKDIDAIELDDSDSDNL
ncbi:AIPR family protein [Vibrio coralliirubri]|uniref:AIPR family protein n=1 Tax=Vibrio coralliirubri TaxID=1516159 RepID=UPI0006334D33|nr:AIPR family protein [Vibrio coralliirubri]CDT76443.1 conserved hypothetical protein [Vibrio coralliirubri]